MTRVHPEWQRLPGTARRYQNTETGEVLSRTQYDQRYGRFAGQAPGAKERAAKERKTLGLSSHVQFLKRKDGSLFVRFTKGATLDDRRAAIRYQREHGRTMGRFLYQKGKERQKTTFWQSIESAADEQQAEDMIGEDFTYADETYNGGDITGMVFA